MGNEKSALSGLEVDEKAIEITDFWIHHGAVTHGSNTQNLSVFVSEPSLHSGASFGKPSPLERKAKNLMLHRHPNILRYVSSWKEGSKFYLATEEAKPLIQVIGSQTVLQICIGLHNILGALIFLHEKASASHNNVCCSSIYVTPEGSWKLGGMEYLCKFTEMTNAYFQKIKSYRCEKAIGPDESVVLASPEINFTAIDRFAFGVLVEEVLKLKTDDDVPARIEFMDFCKRQLQNPDPALRPSLTSLLNNPFFTHDFIRIHAFLSDLPLKSETEKQEFFSHLVKQLRVFPERIVVEQLGKLLLSRMVLLDRTAQEKLLPFVLKPRDEDKEGDEEEEEENDGCESGLFTIQVFRNCLAPKLLQMFCIRDVSVRLLLLKHFSSYMNIFQTEELKTQILPELLVGIKDTNDYLVSVTLKTLGDLVPVLGASTVIGGKRAKLFTDGRPTAKNARDRAKLSSGPFENKTDASDRNSIHGGSRLLDLPERPSPDGGEDKMESNFSFAEEESNWSDWDLQESVNNESKAEPEDPDEEPETKSPPGPLNNAKDETKEGVMEKVKLIAPDPDVPKLEAKHSKSMDFTVKDEFDFFTDMEPVIQKPQVLHVEEIQSLNKHKFEVNYENENDRDVESNAWTDDLNDWGGNVDDDFLEANGASQ